MEFDTFFGLFSQSVFTAIGSMLASLTGQPVSFNTLHLSTTNTLKLRWSEIDTVILPQLAQSSEVKWVLGLGAHDVAEIKKLAAGRIGLNKLMEQALAAAQEPFNFIHKQRLQLGGVQFSRNVTGLTAHHLDGEVSYTMATGVFSQSKGRDFEMRLLVTSRGRDLIEDRTTQPHTQRALFSINEGAYVCRPQWEPPPPPPGMEKGLALSESMMNGWLQSFLGRNDSVMSNRLFRRTTGLSLKQSNTEALSLLADTDGPPFVVRLQLEQQKEVELFAVLGQKTVALLMPLSKSGQERFLGDFFRVLYGESLKVWSEFSQTPATWKLLAARRIPADAMDAVSGRLEEGGLVLKQTARMDEAHLDWLVAIPPHTWHWMMRMTAKGMSHPVSTPPNRQGIFQATGWGEGRVPWGRLLPLLSDRDLQDLVQVMQRARLNEAHLKAVAETLTGAGLEKWLDAMPVMLRERTQNYRLADGEGARRLLAVSHAMAPLSRARKLPPGRLALWAELYTEYLWSFRQHLIDQILPMRHLVYGMDRDSLGRLLYQIPNQLLVDVLCWVEFPVLDQIRRAITPNFAMRLLEDVESRRQQLTAYGAQEAMLEFYRQGMSGLTEGKFLVRATPAKKLQEVFNLLEEDV